MYHELRDILNWKMLGKCLLSTFLVKLSLRCCFKSFIVIFCFGWVEKKKVFDRMIEILDNSEEIPRFWNVLLKSKYQKSKSYENVKGALDDPLLIVKLNFFSYVAGIEEPFFKKFQPMIPFLFFFELKTIVISLLEIIMKPSVVESCKSTKRLISINLYDQIIYYISIKWMLDLL